MEKGRPEAGAWLDVADPLTTLLWRQHGVITRTQALTYISPKSLEHRVSSGRWQRVHRAVYVTHTGTPTTDQRLCAPCSLPDLVLC